MRTFCAILLMGTIVGMAHGQQHDCDPLAMDLLLEDGTDPAAEERKAQSGHGEAYVKNEGLKLSEFAKKLNVVYYVTHASRSDIDEANVMCTAATHGEDCTGVEYVSKFAPGYELPAEIKSLTGVQVETTSVGWDNKDKYAIKTKGIVATQDHNDYIFRYVGAVSAEKLDKDGKVIESIFNIPEAIKKVVKDKPFALNSFNKTNGRALYVTCDGKYGWVASPRPKVETTPAEPIKADNDLKGAIERLYEAVSKNREGVKLEINLDGINATMPAAVSKQITALVATAA